MTWLGVMCVCVCGWVHVVCACGATVMPVKKYFIFILGFKAYYNFVPRGGKLEKQGIVCQKKFLRIFYLISYITEAT